MKKGICIGCLPQHLTLEDQFALARKAGFDGIEPRGTVDPEEARSLKSLADKHSLALPSIMGGIQWQTPLSSPDVAVRKDSMDNIKASIDCARIMGADLVLVIPGLVNDVDTTYQQCWDRTLVALKELAPYAEDNQVYLGLENVWNKFLHSPLEFADFIDAVGSPYVQMYFDVGNHRIFGYPEQWIEILGSRIKKVHFKDFVEGSRDFANLLEGDVNWQKVVEALRGIGYDDFVTVEVGLYRACAEQAVYDHALRMDRILSGNL
ncbi:MAG: sugar phosphate isomerase/epimerase [Armatimonadetes bacterium]|nr:sugar phosphate isomerase/epimerase [Armatimonadota bacterium]